MWIKGEINMATLKIFQDAAAQETRIKALTEENELLIKQLHVVQEELEKYYHKLKECEQSKGQTGGGTLVAVSPQAAEALAENTKLRALVEQQEIALRVETQNSLASRLGQMLITGVSSAGSLLALPGRLRKMWKAVEQTTPPAALGGKTFQKVIDAHGTGGPEAVEKLLDSVFISPAMRANAYTALARHLMLTDARKAVVSARLAWETDPRPYRLKWLAFRMHDADDVVTAEAMLDMLPADITMSESEQRQVMRIRQESRQMCNETARNDTSLKAHIEEENKKIDQLSREAEEQKRKAERLAEQSIDLQNAVEKHKRDVELLRAERIKAQNLVKQQKDETDSLKSELAGLQNQVDALEKLAGDRKNEITVLNATNLELQNVVKLGKEKTDILRSERTEMKTLVEQWKEKVESLRTRSEELQILVDERKKEVDRLNARHDEMRRFYQEEVKNIAVQQKEILSAMASHDSILDSNFKKQDSELERVRKSIQQACKYEIDNCLQQMVAYNGLSEYFGIGKLPEVIPWKRGWSASPDFILWQVELIDENDYDLILEFGSGITTLYTAKMLATRQKKGSSEKNTQAVTFEHLEQFFLQTRDNLMQEKLGENVNIVHVPLQEYTAPDGISYQYYSCQEFLAALSQKYKSSASRILVIVDGPPGGTNKNARYPAFPVVMKYFAPAHIDFLLDDYIRNDEKELAGMWQAACATAGIDYAIVERQLEKEALLLRITPSHAG